MALPTMLNAPRSLKEAVAWRQSSKSGYERNKSCPRAVFRLTIETICSGSFTGRPRMSSAFTREDCGRGADPNRERRHRDDSESWTLDECPQTVAEILQTGIRECACSAVTDPLFDLLDAAKLDGGRSTRLFPRHAGLHLLGDQHVQRAPHFVIQIALGTIAMVDVSPETREPQHHGPRPRQVASARAIAATIRFHWSASSPSCRCPALVSR
jgi:hypothetical protein